MKSLPVLVFLLIAIPVSRAADNLSPELQRGLFEEEANQDFNAAIKAYQSVLGAHDDQRKLAATALFRLGECYRKLGKTNDAITQYQHLVADYADQAALANLSRQNLIGLGITGNGGQSGNSGERIRFLEQMLSGQQAEASKTGALLQQLQALPRSEVRNVLPTAAPDPLLNRLLEELALAERKLTGQSVTLAATHPEVKATRDIIEKLNAQIDERIGGILNGLKVKAEALAKQTEELRKELASLAARRITTGTTDDPGTADPAARAQLKELLQSEIKIAEQFATEQRKKVEMGTLAPGDQVRFERDVLNLKRQLIAADGLNSAEDRARWRELLLQEIKLAEDATRFERQKLDAGKSMASEVARLQRDVLILKRELVSFGAAPSASPTGGGSRPAYAQRLQAVVQSPADGAATDDEEKEIRRIRALIKDSPDLINTPVAKGPSLRTPLEHAAAAGQVTVARFLLANGAEVNKSGSGWGSLNLAALNGHKSMVELLLANGAGIEMAGPDGRRPLAVAVSKGFKGVVEVLLASKANPNEPDAPNKLSSPPSDNKWAPLHAAADIGNAAIAKLLIAKGATVNSRTAAGETPLYLAASGGFDDLVELLLDHKAAVDTRTSNGWTPLHEAAQHGHEGTAKLLLARAAEVDAADKMGRTPLSIAAMNGRPAMVPLLLAGQADPNRRDDSGLTPLDHAANRDNPELIAALLAGKADPNSSAKPRSWTPLYNVVTRNQTGLAELLLKAGANPNVRIETDTSYPLITGMTPLLKAVAKGSVPTVKVLLAYKADPNLANDAGDAPLHWVVSASNIDNVALAALAEELLKHGANAAGLNSSGQLLLAVAISRGRNELVELLLNHKANPNVRDRNGLAPVHHAVGFVNTRAMELLLARKADPNITDREGRTALDYVKNDIRLELGPGGPRALNRIRSVTPTPAQPEFSPQQSNLLDTLRQNGATEWATRPGQITLTRRSNGALRAVFQKGTNDLNQFTLHEVIAAVGWGGNLGQWAFPDFSRVTVSRLNDKTGKMEEIPVDLTASAASSNCSGNIPVRWGDLVNVPESEHGLNATWFGMPEDFTKAIGKCLERSVTITLKGRSQKLSLTAKTLEGKKGVFGGQGAYPAYAFTPVDFWLRTVLQGSGLLLNSSDLTRVKVKRADNASRQTQEWTFDVNQLSSPNDLWLRDGDEIDVPEK